MIRNLAIALVVICCAPPAFPQGGNIVTIEQYEDIVDPLYDAFMPTISLDPGGQAMVPLLEAWRLTQRWFLESLDAMVDDATAVAMTTEAVKNLKIGLHPVKERSFMLIEKLKKDLAIYDAMYPELRGGLLESSRSDPEKVEAEKHYQAIRDALKRYEFTVTIKKGEETVRERVVLENVEEKLKQATAEVHGDPQNRAQKPGKIMDVLRRLTRARVAISQIDPTMKFLAEPLAELRKVQVGVEHMASSLVAHSPKKQLLLRVKNFAEDMNYLVQIQTREGQGAYRPRYDTMYPIMVVRRRSPDVKETSYWMPLGLGDKLVIRALTMNEHRREILYKPIDRHKEVVDGTEVWKRYDYVRPEMNSWTRTPYLLGYEVAQGTRKLVTRIYSVEESYTWKFSGGWTSGEIPGVKPPELTSSEARALRQFSEPLAMRNDTMAWVMPDTWVAAEALARPENVMTAEVAGEATIIKKGPTSRSEAQRLIDRGSGRLMVIVERW